VLKLSELLNRRLVTYEKDASRRSWWKFFMLMDQDKAGVVAYSRFLKLMRIQLEIPERQAPDKLLRSVWKALDYDETGWINSAKWGPFMKRGEGATPRPGQGLPTGRRGSCRGGTARSRPWTTSAMARSWRWRGWSTRARRR